MRRLQQFAAAAALVATAALAGCAPPEPAAAVVRIGTTGLQFRVEVADTADQQRAGLSGREPVREGTGMLFRFGSRGEQQVWMAGMTAPLDVAWIVDGQILAVDTLAPCTQPDQQQCPRWTSPSPVDALLEVPAEALDGVVPGMNVTVEEQP